MDEALCQPQTLAVPLREFTYVFLDNIRKPTSVNNRSDSLFPIAFRELPHLCHEIEIFEDTHIGVKRRTFREVTDPFSNLNRFFKYIVACNSSTPRIRGKVAGEDTHGSCFSGTVGTEKT